MIEIFAVIREDLFCFIIVCIIPDCVVIATTHALCSLDTQLIYSSSVKLYIMNTHTRYTTFSSRHVKSHKSTDSPSTCHTVSEIVHRQVHSAILANGQTSAWPGDDCSRFDLTYHARRS